MLFHVRMHSGTRSSAARSVLLPQVRREGRDVTFWDFVEKHWLVSSMALGFVVLMVDNMVGNICLAIIKRSNK